MDSKEYWQRREDENTKRYIKQEEEYDRQIEKIYDDMLDGVQKEIDSFYGRYANREGITIAETKKRVSKLDIAEYQRKAQRYVREKNFSEKANEEMRLYNLTMKVNRLEMLKAGIGLEMLKGHAELETFMEKILQGRTEEELKRQADILGNTVKDKQKLARAIPNASFHNAAFSDRIWMYHDMMKADLSKLLQTGLIQGKNPRQLASEIRKYYYGDERLKNGKNGAVYNMERLMRTEMARVQTEAQRQSFIENGFTQYLFLANSGCCAACQANNGRHFKIEDMKPGDNAPPIHPQCRCSTAAWEDSEEYEAWLDYLSQGGTTKQWNASGREEWEKAQKALAKSSESSTIEMKKGKKLSLSNLEELENWQNDYYQINSHLELTKENFPNINTYTGNSYEGINTVERFAKGSPQYERYDKAYHGIERFKDVSKGISKEIAKFKNPCDLQVYRYVGDVDYITGKTSSVDDMRKAIGKKYTEKGFTSTTVCGDSTLPFGGYKDTKTKLEIYVPKETRGAYVYKLSDSPAEFEYLIDKNTTFKVVDAGVRDVQIKDYEGNVKTVKERFMKLEVII